MAAAVASAVDLNAAASAARAKPTAVAAATAAAPLFPGRPDFPRGLNVLLIDDAGAACCGAARVQLEQLGYKVAVLPAHALATDPAQMRQQLLQQQGEPQPGSSSPAGGALFDVVLADLPTTAAAAGDGGVRALAAAAGAAGVPLVLMGARCGAAQVMEGVDAGAADFLERPLSGLKLQNLWQHAVRRAMAVRRPCSSADAVAGAAGARRRLTLKRCGSSAAPCGAASACAAAWPDGGADEHAPAVSSPYGCGAAASPCGPSLDEEDELEALVFGSLDCDMDHPAHLAGADLAAAACDALRCAAPAYARPAAPVGAGAGPALLLPGTPSADCSGGMSLEDSLEDSWCCDGPFGGGGGSGAGLRGGAAHALTAAALDELELGLRCGAPRPSQLMRLDSSASTATAAGASPLASSLRGAPPAFAPPPPRAPVPSQPARLGGKRPAPPRPAPAPAGGHWGYTWPHMPVPHALSALPAPHVPSPPPGCSGMVWGMPMPSVITAPGIPSYF